MYIMEYSDLILNAMDPDDTLVHYEAAEPFTTKVKHMNFSKAVGDLKHNPRVTPEE